MVLIVIIKQMSYTYSSVQLLDALETNEQIQIKLTQFIQLQNNQQQTIIEDIIHSLKDILLDKQAKLIHKYNSLFAVKSLFATGQFTTINYIEMHLLPIIQNIASFELPQIIENPIRGCRYFTHLGYDKSFPQIGMLGFNFVRLATELIFMLAEIKPRQIIKTQQIRQRSLFYLSAANLKSKGEEIDREWMYFREQDQAYLRSNYMDNIFIYQDEYLNKIVFQKHNSDPTFIANTKDIQQYKVRFMQMQNQIKDGKTLIQEFHYCIKKLIKKRQALKEFKNNIDIKINAAALNQEDLQIINKKKDNIKDNIALIQDTISHIIFLEQGLKNSSSILLNRPNKSKGPAKQIIQEQHSSNHHNSNTNTNNSNTNINSNPHQDQPKLFKQKYMANQNHKVVDDNRKIKSSVQISYNHPVVCHRQEPNPQNDITFMNPLSQNINNQTQLFQLPHTQLISIVSGIKDGECSNVSQISLFPLPIHSKHYQENKRHYIIQNQAIKQKQNKFNEEQNIKNCTESSKQQLPSFKQFFKDSHQQLSVNSHLLQNDIAEHLRNSIHKNSSQASRSNSLNKQKNESTNSSNAKTMKLLIDKVKQLQFDTFSMQKKISQHDLILGEENIDMSLMIENSANNRFNHQRTCFRREGNSQKIARARHRKYSISKKGDNIQPKNICHLIDQSIYEVYFSNICSEFTKKCILRPRLSLLKNDKIQFGSEFTKQDNYLSIKYYITPTKNITNLTYKLNLQQNSPLKINIMPNDIKQIKGGDQQMIQIKVETKIAFYNLPQIIFSYRLQTYTFQHMFVIPCPFYKFISISSDSQEDIKNAFEDQKRVIVKTKAVPYSYKFMKQSQNLNIYLPNGIFLQSNRKNQKGQIQYGLKAKWQSLQFYLKVSYKKNNYLYVSASCDRTSEVVEYCAAQLAYLLIAQPQSKIQ